MTDHVKDARAELMVLIDDAHRQAYRAGWADGWAAGRSEPRLAAEEMNAPRASLNPKPCQDGVATGNRPSVLKAAPPKEPEPGADGERSRDEARISEGGEDGKADPGDDARASPHPDTTDCAVLDSLTPGQWQLFQAVVALRGEYEAGEKIAAKCGMSHGSVTGHMVALVRKGYVTKRGVGGGRFAYDVAVHGAPKVAPSIKDPRKGKAAAVIKAAQRATPQDPQIVGDPPAGTSVFDKAQAIAELRITEYLDRRGHQVRVYPSGRQFNIDGSVRDLRYTLELVNKYRAKAKEQPLDVARYL